MIDEQAAERRGRMAVNQDPRALRTRERLVAAYRELAEVHGHDDVTVSELVKRAGVNRTSFYAHFAGTDAVAAEALTDFFAIIASSDTAARRSGDRSPAEASLDSLSEVIRFVVDRRGTYAALLRRSDGFLRAVESRLADSVRPTLEEGPRTSDPEVTARFVAAGVLGVLAWWLEGEHDWSPERLAAELAQILPPDFVRPVARPGHEGAAGAGRP